MDHQYNSDAPRTFVLNLKLHPEEICERKLKRWLEMIKGVRSVDVNAQQGKVTITGTTDPATIVMMLKNYGKNGIAAEVLREQRRAKYGYGIQKTAESRVKVVHDQLDDPKMVQQIQQLSAMEDTEEVEVTYSKIVKVTFDRQKNKKSVIEDQDVEVNTKSSYKDTVDSPQIANGGCCRLCVASASCCGGHGMHNFHGHHPPIHPRAASPPEPAPSWPVYIIPSAPPLSYVNNPSHPPPPPPPAPPPQPSYSMFSDENPNACVIQ